MFPRNPRFAKRFRNMERNQKKLLKEFEKLKNKKEHEGFENQHSEEQQSAWRQFMDNQSIQDAVNLTKYYGLGGAGLKIAHTKINEQLTEAQQKALLASIETSYALIEQQNNDCHTMDYWSKTEENKMLRLKTVEVKKPVWQFWN